MYTHINTNIQCVYTHIYIYICICIHKKAVPSQRQGLPNGEGNLAFGFLAAICLKQPVTS